MKALAGVLACLWILSGTVSAQVFGRARIPPTRIDPPTTTRPVNPPRPAPPATYPEAPTFLHGGDLFLAGPHTYAPRYDRPSNRYPSGPFFPRTHGYLGDVYVPSFAPSGYAPPVAPTSAVEMPSLRTIESPPLPPLPPMAPGVPKTFYVIPRCYAGDIPPRADQLPPGCDVESVRTVPPSRAIPREP